MNLGHDAVLEVSTWMAERRCCRYFCVAIQAPIQRRIVRQIPPHCRSYSQVPFSDPYYFGLVATGIYTHAEGALNPSSQLTSPLTLILLVSDVSHDLLLTS